LSSGNLLGGAFLLDLFVGEGGGAWNSSSSDMIIFLFFPLKVVFMGWVSELSWEEGEPEDMMGVSE
jgi:hypothetical protein